MESQDYFYIAGSCFDAGDDNQHSHDILNFHQNNNNHFAVDGLLDFSKGDDIITDSFFDDHSSLPSFHTSNSSSSGNESHRINSCSSFTDAPFSGNELFVPYNELPETPQWISNFENDSFSNDELQNFQFISSTAAPTDTSSSQSADEFRPKLASGRNYSPIFGMDMSIPGKARSKRSRAAPCDWSSRILLVNNSSSSKVNNGTDLKTLPSKEMEDAGESTSRKCVHCGSVKTPQWRSGPTGPKTLCNACGVRHKSGRFVPEYRPAASPTFVPAKHSNSHRKVVELRRQKEMLVAQQLFTQRSIFSASSGCDYLIRGQTGTDFRQIRY